MDTGMIMNMNTNMDTKMNKNGSYKVHEHVLYMYMKKA
jgi:hypothetical protein